MGRFLLGAVAAVAIVVFGFMLVGLAVTLFVRSGAVPTEHIATDGYQAGLDAGAYLLNVVPSALAAFVHVRLTPERLLGAKAAVACAVLLVLAVNAALGGLAALGASELAAVLWLTATAGVGALLGGVLAARRRARRP